MSRRVETVSLVGRGWPVLSPCVAVVRLRDRPGYAVGVQSRLRGGGIGRVWPRLIQARTRASYLAHLHSLPIVEAL